MSSLVLLLRTNGDENGIVALPAEIFQRELFAETHAGANSTPSFKMTSISAFRISRGSRYSGIP